VRRSAVPVPVPVLAVVVVTLLAWASAFVGIRAVGALCCLPWAGALVTELGEAPPGSVAGLVYLGVVPTALAFSTWAYALARTDAGRLGITTYLVPPLVVLMGWLLLDEVPPALAVLGGAVCLAGVALSRRRERVRPPAREATARA